MKRYTNIFCALMALMLFAFGCGTQNDHVADQTENTDSQTFNPSVPPLFKVLSNDLTGVHFINTIVEDLENNLQYDQYYYNGCGVAVGDIDNDGLPDLYFTGNNDRNKLYHNEGDFKFTDITYNAGVDGGRTWCTGVTMVDINYDGYIDIYVCRGATLEKDADKRRNLFYINNGDLTFTERGAEYGLDDPGYSVQAAFFDYDLDGDLDMYLTNRPNQFKMGFEKRIEVMQFPEDEVTDKLFRNNGDGTFTNVSEIAGIKNYGHGLGVGAGDLNGDGYPDIYVANDYEAPDFYYMNNGDGTFTEMGKVALKHGSLFGMGSDIADINNDGLLDIFVADMTAEDNLRQKTLMAAMDPEKFWSYVDYGFHYQYMRNTLHLNNGNGSFSEIGLLAGIPNTDWSWTALLADYDNDGFKDLAITNGYLKDMMDKDYQKALRKLVDEKQGHITLEDREKILPFHRAKSYLFQNNGDLTFTDMSNDWNFNIEGYSSGAAYADLDNDGDLDFVINNINDQASILENLARNNGSNNFLRINLIGDKQNLMGYGAKVSIETEEGMQFCELYATRGYQSSVEPVIHFGLGKVSTVHSINVVWLDGMVSTLTDIAVNQEIEIDKKDAVMADPIQEKRHQLVTEVSGEYGIDWKHKENLYDDYAIESLLPHKMSRFGPNVAVGDINGDGLEDFYVGGASWQPGQMFIQNENGTFDHWQDELWQKDKGFEDIGILIFDADMDGDNDLYVVSGGNEFPANSPLLRDRLYINDGTGNFKRDNDRIPQISTSGSCVISADYDKDGDLDLFIGGRVLPATYPYPANSHILQNNNGYFTDVTARIAPDLVKPGLVTSAVWTDFNGDNAMDLIIVGEWMPITFFKNNKGNFENVTASMGLPVSTGWWNKIISVDLDKDGDQDYVLGNLGLNYKYRVTEKEPLHIYCKDFDNTGTLDIVLGYYNQNICYPVRGRQCTYEQMPFIQQKFPTYHAFGSATLFDVYGEALNDALHYEANNFASSQLMNNGDGSFELIQLPIEAQFSSVFGIIAKDFDNDQDIDLILAGNFYVSEVETGRADASIGLFLQGNGKGEFRSMTVVESGFNADLDVRDIDLIELGKGNNEYLILVCNNDDKMQVFHLKITNRPFENEELALK